MTMACDRRGNDEAMLSEGDESNDDIFPSNFAETVACLPQVSHWILFPSLRLHRGFWLPDIFLLNLPKVHASFEKRPADILFASFPKSGTTWLKALGFATARRSVHSPFDAAHPLLSCSSPHICVKFIDTLRFLEDDGCATETEPRPRLMSTHLPYSLLPRRARAGGGGAGCRIVYISRDPKDTLVSLWHFDSRGKWSQGEAAGTTALEFDEAFELYCQGQCGLGPQWEHVREYWEASKRRPGSVLFLRYEEMLQDPAGNIKKLAEFMGCPFSAAEEDAGVVRAILEMCSLDKQRNLAVNKTRAYELYSGGFTIENRYFFRKGIVGDWKNHMTPEMAARLDGIAEQALEGSGFTFGNAAPSTGN